MQYCLNVTQHFQDFALPGIAVETVVETALSVETVAETALSEVETVAETALSEVETALYKIENGSHSHGIQHFPIVLAEAY